MTATTSTAAETFFRLTSIVFFKRFLLNLFKSLSTNIKILQKDEKKTDCANFGELRGKIDHQQPPTAAKMSNKIRCGDVRNRGTRHEKIRLDRSRKVQSHAQKNLNALPEENQENKKTNNNNNMDSF